MVNYEYDIGNVAVTVATDDDREKDKNFEVVKSNCRQADKTLVTPKVMTIFTTMAIVMMMTMAIMTMAMMIMI